jgi:hypothetical protein
MEWWGIPLAPGRMRSKVTKSLFYFFTMSREFTWDEAGRWSLKKTMEELVRFRR